MVLPLRTVLDVGLEDSMTTEADGGQALRAQNLTTVAVAIGDVVELRFVGDAGWQAAVPSATNQHARKYGVALAAIGIGESGLFGVRGRFQCGVVTASSHSALTPMIPAGSPGAGNLNVDKAAAIVAPSNPGAGNTAISMAKVIAKVVTTETTAAQGDLVDMIFDGINGFATQTSVLQGS